MGGNEADRQCEDDPWNVEYVNHMTVKMVATNVTTDAMTFQLILHALASVGRRGVCGSSPPFDIVFLIA